MIAGVYYMSNCSCVQYVVHNITWAAAAVAAIAAFAVFMKYPPPDAVLLRDLLADVSDSRLM
jgi:hypothetical protein